MGGEVRLAEEAGPVALRGQPSREPAFSRLDREVDAVVAHAMGTW
jgi:hypothetical protein